MIDHIDTTINNYLISFVTRRKNQEGFVRQLNSKLSEARGVRMKIRDIQELLWKLKNSEEQLTKNINEVSVE